MQRMPAEEQSDPGRDLHQQAGGLGNCPARADAIPDHGGALGGPEGGSHLGVEGERHSDGREEGGNPEMGVSDERRSTGGAVRDQPQSMKYQSEPASALHARP